MREMFINFFSVLLFDFVDIFIRSHLNRICLKINIHGVMYGYYKLDGFDNLILQYTYNAI